MELRWDLNPLPRRFLSVARLLWEERTTLTSHYRADGPRRPGSPVHSQDVDAAAGLRVFSLARVIVHQPQRRWGVTVGEAADNGFTAQNLKKEIQPNMPALPFRSTRLGTRLGEENDHMVQLMGVWQQLYKKMWQSFWFPEGGHCRSARTPAFCLLA